MSYSLKLTSNDGTIVVDMTDMNPNFNFDYNNPIIKIPTPQDENDIISNTALWKTVTLNINMSTQTVMVDFTESSGLGNLGSAINFDSPTTVFEKIIKLSVQPNDKKKKLIINDVFFAYVEIEGYRVSIDAGRKDLVKHNLTLPLVADEGTD